jgi:8-oxo-dGTP pyrophosphatase MutT (NUDIX family)
VTAVESFEERMAAFWRDAEGAPAERLRTELDELLAGRPAGDSRALFERAGLHDFLGEEREAIPLYRASLDAGLEAPLRTQAVIQLASSLRTEGEPSQALALLRTVAASDPLFPAAQAFLALALHDDDKPTPALRTALRALAPHLPMYARSVAAYADALPPRERVRVIVVGLLVHDGHVLAEAYPATAHHGGFLRAPGGGVDFGETADAAIRREFAEELGVVLDEARLLAVTENIFTSGPKRGHELVHVYAVRSAALELLPLTHRLPVLDSDTTVGWYSLDELSSGTPALHPAGVLDLARRLAGTASSV